MCLLKCYLVQCVLLFFACVSICVVRCVYTVPILPRQSDYVKWWYLHFLEMPPRKLGETVSYNLGGSVNPDIFSDMSLRWGGGGSIKFGWDIIHQELIMA